MNRVALVVTAFWVGVVASFERPAYMILQHPKLTWVTVSHPSDPAFFYRCTELAEDCYIQNWYMKIYKNSTGVFLEYALIGTLDKILECATDTHGWLDSSGTNISRFTCIYTETRTFWLDIIYDDEFYENLIRTSTTIVSTTTLPITHSPNAYEPGSTVPLTVSDTTLASGVNAETDQDERSGIRSEQAGIIGGIMVALVIIGVIAYKRRQQSQVEAILFDTSTLDHKNIPPYNLSEDTDNSAGPDPYYCSPEPNPMYDQAGTTSSSILYDNTFDVPTDIPGDQTECNGIARILENPHYDNSFNT